MIPAPCITRYTRLYGDISLDDPIDKLSSLITSFFFFFSAVLISAKVYVGTPMQCWMPKYYLYEWTKMVEGFCFLRSTYWFPPAGSLADMTDEHKKDYRINYYQYSSMYLLLAAFISMLPKFLWRSAQTVTDIQLDYFYETTYAVCMETTAERADKIIEMAKFIRNKITANRTSYSMSFVSLYVFYQLIKWFYVVVAVAQFYFLGVFIGQKDNLFWGWQLSQQLVTGGAWESTGIFPRITLCDFQNRMLQGNHHKETVECLIGINEFNETIFLFLWYWLLFLIPFTVIGAVYTLNRDKYVDFVCSLLHSIHTPSSQLERATIKEFANDYLTMDGKLILSYIKAQNDIVAQEMAIYMYNDYISQDRPKMYGWYDTSSTDTDSDIRIVLIGDSDYDDIDNETNEDINETEHEGFNEVTNEEIHDTEEEGCDEEINGEIDETEHEGINEAENESFDPEIDHLSEETKLEMNDDAFDELSFNSARDEDPLNS